MLESVRTLFDQYIDGTSRYSIHSVEMERGENPEDLYYLCFIGDRQYIIYETDYVGSLSDTLDEIKEIFEQRNLHPLHWLVKKEHHTSVGVVTISTKQDDFKNQQNVLIFKDNTSHLRYAIIEVSSEAGTGKRFDPNAYGGATPAE